MEKKKTYSELLRSPLWQKKRLEIMQRDDFACQHCGSEDNELQVHHLVYHKGAKPWEYDNSELITLCSHCHEVETEAKSQHYETFKEICKLGREVGFSEQYIGEMFNTVFRVIESIATNSMSGIDKDIAYYTLLNTCNNRDASILFENGLVLNDDDIEFLKIYCQDFVAIYNKHKEEEK